MITIEWRDPQLNLLGPVNQWQSIELVVNYNYVGTWTLVLNASEENWIKATTQNIGILVHWHDQFVFSGFAESYEYSVDNNGAETITLTGADDLALLANRVAYALPTSVWTDQDWRYSDAQLNLPAETIMKHFVQANLIDAYNNPDRKVPFIVCDPDQERGGTTSYTAIDYPGTYVLSIARSIDSQLSAANGASAGSFGVRVTQDSGQLHFDCYVPQDLTQEVLISQDLGNLESCTITYNVPTCDVALGTAAQPDPTDDSGVDDSGVTDVSPFTQTLGNYYDDPWLRVESLVETQTQIDTTDTSGSTDDTSDDPGQDAIDQGAETLTIAVTAIDLPHMRFGINYGLGDKIAVGLRNGQVYSDIVTAVTLSSSSDSESVVPTIGTSENQTDATTATADDSNTDTAALQKQIDNLKSLVSRLAA